MSTLNLTGSFIIGGIVLLIILSLCLHLSSKARSTVMSEIAQSNTIEFGKVIEYDFNKLGYRVGGGGKIVNADSMSITFLSDLDNNGVVDSVYYYGQQSGSGLKIVRRTSINPSKTFSIDVSNFSIQGIDSTGNLTFSPTAIRNVIVIIEINEAVQMKEETDHVGVVWRRRFSPRNL